MTRKLNLDRILRRSSLPADVKEHVRVIVNRARLAEGDDAEVLEELVSHFEDGLASGTTKAQLIEWAVDAFSDHPSSP